MLFQNVNKDIWVPSLARPRPHPTLLTFITELTLYKSWACVLSQCDDSQNHAEASPGPVEGSQALGATGRNDALEVVFECSREPEVLCVTID